MSGEVAAAIRALVDARQPGALIQIEPRGRSLAARREAGLARDDEGRLLERAWAIIGARAGDGVGRRAGWAAYDLVLGGTPGALVSTARGLHAALLADADLARWEWQLALTAITDDVDRVLMSDASDDLAQATGDVIAWVEPYAGPDWRAAQRYPTVTFETAMAQRKPHG